MSLIDQIKDLQSKPSGNADQVLSPEAAHAMKLAEQFSEIQPEPYVLPLDAMAGFPVAVRNRTE